MIVAGVLLALAAAGGISYYVTALGRNKKSISLNLKDPEVVDIFKKLAAEADIIVESFAQ